MAEVHFAITGIECRPKGMAQRLYSRPMAGDGVRITELIPRLVIHVGYILGIALEIGEADMRIL